MNSKHLYRIISDKKLLIDYLAGTFTVTELINCKIIQSKDINYDPTFNVLVDLRDASIQFKKDELSGLLTAPYEYRKLLGKRKIAYLTQTPNHVVFTTMLASMGGIPMKMKIYSTLEAAISWVGLYPDDEIYIDKLLNEIKTQLTF